jgi:hypothetical protein
MPGFTDAVDVAVMIWLPFLVRIPLTLTMAADGKVSCVRLVQF